MSSPDHLLAYLHECGVVYHRSGLMNDSIILDQEWALEAIYTVFNREKCWRHLRQLRGRFTREVLETLVWGEFDPKEQALFIDLMETAGICFVHRQEDSRKGIDTEYVAPDLLPEEEEIAEELEPYWREGVREERVIDFSFEYPGLVRGVIARIGRSAGSNAIYWRNGVCVYDRRSGSSARVDTLPADPENPYGVRLRIQTQNGRAKDLLVQLVEWVGEEAKQAGCREEIQGGDEKSKVQPVRKSILEQRDRHDDQSSGADRIEPDFDLPPRRAEKTYCVSYAWTRESSKFVDRVCEDAQERGIEVIRDKTHLGLGERISKFMRKLAAGDRVFVILSKKYLESPFCMFELFEIWRLSKREDDELLSRVRVYRLPDAKISSIPDRMKIGLYWKKEVEAIQALFDEGGTDVIGPEDFERFKMMQEFSLHVGSILNLVMDTLQPTSIEQFEEFAFED